LPPVPLLHPKEPIYEDICQETLLSNRIFKSNSDLEEQGLIKIMNDTFGKSEFF